MKGKVLSMTKKNLVVRSGMVLALAGLGSVLAVQPASAHATIYSKTRSGCHYSGGVNSGDSFAWTQKDSGGCTGHAWLKVTYTNGTSSGDQHASGRVEAYGHIRYAYHKSQSNESWVRSH
jgi:hypothetical protein